MNKGIRNYLTLNGLGVLITLFIHNLAVDNFIAKNLDIWKEFRIFMCALF